MKKALILLTAVVIAGGVLIWVKGNNQSLQPPSVQLSPTGPQQTASNSSGMMVESNAVYVNAPGVSNTLTVSMVTLAESGYVVIHADTNGKPGSVLGYSDLLSAGTHNNVPVQLSRKTVKGETIYAMLHKEKSDKVYTSADEPIKGSNDEPIMMIINVDDEDNTSPGAVSM